MLTQVLGRLGLSGGTDLEEVGRAFEQAGQFPHRDDPERFVETLDKFLAREWGVDQTEAAALGA
jgi:hypothetical protein